VHNEYNETEEPTMRNTLVAADIFNEIARTNSDAGLLREDTVKRLAGFILFGGSTHQSRLFNQRVKRLMKLTGQDRETIVADLIADADAYHA